MKILRGLLSGLSTLALSCSSAKIARDPASRFGSYPAVLEATGQKYEITVSGGGDDSFYPPSAPPPKNDGELYDVIIVGGGLSGLTAAIYLTEKEKHVLLLEKEDFLGGLAAHNRTSDGIVYDRGAAYYTRPNLEEYRILQHIGLGKYDKTDRIPEPIDTYHWAGKLYGTRPAEGLWDDHTLGPAKAGGPPTLPASFALFKYELKKLASDGLIPVQPIEEFAADSMQQLNKQDEKVPGSRAKELAKMFDTYGSGFKEANYNYLDTLTAKQMVELMPIWFKAHAKRDHRSEVKELGVRWKELLAKNPKNPMEDVLQLLDLYTRSALGAPTDRVSAMAFANFYISEIETRYTTEEGTGAAAGKMNRLLTDQRSPRTQFFNGKLNAPVIGIRTTDSGVEVDYIENGVGKTSRGQYLVFAAQLKMAPRLIEGFAAKSPTQSRLMAGLGYSHYSVHAVKVKGHPYRESYDTWINPDDNDQNAPTDLIVGRWMDPAIEGYKGNTNYKRDPDNRGSVLSIYHPLSVEFVKGYSNERAASLAEYGVNRLVKTMGSKLTPKPLVIESVVTHRWPYSVHVAAKGHFQFRAKELRRPFKNIFFANNNMGTPAFEEALFRGHCAAVNILTRLNQSYEKEEWTKCPIEANTN
jgi:hypothetical protein